MTKKASRPKMDSITELWSPNIPRHFPNDTGQRMLTFGSDLCHSSGRLSRSRTDVLDPADMIFFDLQGPSPSVPETSVF